MAAYLVTEVDRGIGSVLAKGVLAGGHTVIGMAPVGQAPFDALVQNSGVFGPRFRDLSVSAPDDFLEGSKANRASKASSNKLVQTVAHDLKRYGIAIVARHPVWVRTDMGGVGGRH